MHERVEWFERPDASGIQQAHCLECGHPLGNWTHSHKQGCSVRLRQIQSMQNVAYSTQRDARLIKELATGEEMTHRSMLTSWLRWLDL